MEALLFSYVIMQVCAIAFLVLIFYAANVFATESARIQVKCLIGSGSRTTSGYIESMIGTLEECNGPILSCAVNNTKYLYLKYF